jgi:hypothetical protein
VERKSLWTPCCGGHLHTACAQKMALVSGELAFRSGLEIYMQKEVGRNRDAAGSGTLSRREQTRKREVMSSMSILAKSVSAHT